VKLYIKEIRLKSKLTQTELANKAGISLRYLQNIEAGDKKPSIDVLCILAKRLKVSIHELIDD